MSCSGLTEFARPTWQSDRTGFLEAVEGLGHLRLAGAPAARTRRGESREQQEQVPGRPGLAEGQGCRRSAGHRIAR
jgi:hypothetical protein